MSGSTSGAGSGSKDPDPQSNPVPRPLRYALPSLVVPLHTTARYPEIARPRRLDYTQPSVAVPNFRTLVRPRTAIEAASLQQTIRTAIESNVSSFVTRIPDLTDENPYQMYQMAVMQDYQMVPMQHRRRFDLFVRNCTIRVLENCPGVRSVESALLDRFPQRFQMVKEQEYVKRHGLSPAVAQQRDRYYHRLLQENQRLSHTLTRGFKLARVTAKMLPIFDFVMNYCELGDIPTEELPTRRALVQYWSKDQYAESWVDDSCDLGERHPQNPTGQWWKGSHRVFITQTRVMRNNAMACTLAAGLTTMLLEPHLVHKTRNPPRDRADADMAFALLIYYLNQFKTSVATMECEMDVQNIHTARMNLTNYRVKTSGYLHTILKVFDKMVQDSPAHQRFYRQGMRVWKRTHNLKDEDHTRIDEQQGTNLAFKAVAQWGDYCTLRQGLRHMVATGITKPYYDRVKLAHQQLSGCTLDQNFTYQAILTHALKDSRTTEHDLALNQTRFCRAMRILPSPGDSDIPLPPRYLAYRRGNFVPLVQQCGLDWIKIWERVTGRSFWYKWPAPPFTMDDVEDPYAPPFTPESVEAASSSQPSLPRTPDTNPSPWDRISHNQVDGLTQLVSQSLLIHMAQAYRAPSQDSARPSTQPRSESHRAAQRG